MRGIIGELLLLPVHTYRLLRPLLGPPRCRYYPSCSRYAVDVVRQQGAVRGCVLAVWRVLRCNPWSPGGLDPAKKQRIFPLSRHWPRHGVSRETVTER